MYMEESRREVEVYLGRGLCFEATVAIWRQVQLFVDWCTCDVLCTDATRTCPICFEDQSTQNKTCHCLDCGATCCIRCIVPWLPRPCPHCRSEAGLRYVTELPTYNIMKAAVFGSDAGSLPSPYPPVLVRPTDIIPCCCINSSTDMATAERNMGWARAPADRTMVWSWVKGGYYCLVCRRIVPRGKLVASMSDAMNQTGGPPLCPAHGPRALLVQFLSPRRPTDWSGQENGGMGYFW